MSSPAPMVNVESIDQIVRPINNGSLTARLVWVDPAPSATNVIRCTVSDHRRSIRITLWAYDLDTKKFLSERMLKIFLWTGFNARANKEAHFQREHVYGLSMNADDKFNQKFVGRFQVVEGCMAPFLDIIVPQPQLMTQTPLPSPMRSPEQACTPMSMTTMSPLRGKNRETALWSSGQSPSRNPQSGWPGCTFAAKGPMHVGAGGRRQSAGACPPVEYGRATRASAHTDFGPHLGLRPTLQGFGLRCPGFGPKTFNFQLFNFSTSSTFTRGLFGGIYINE